MFGREVDVMEINELKINRSLKCSSKAHAASNEDL